MEITSHIGANFLHEAFSKHTSKNENDCRNILRLISIVIFGVESNSGVKLQIEWSSGVKEWIFEA